jgi:sucrose-6-phosphate hydrolase SacC (GH32 family)
MPASSLGYLSKCDHGSTAFPKSFFDPVKKRRLQYGWVRGPGLQGEDDAMLGTTGLTIKNNHQSLLREITYDPRLGILCFTPVDELALLRKEVLASIPKPTTVAAGGMLPLPSRPHIANQSEIRLLFAMPTRTVTFGVRVMCNGKPSSDAEAPACFEFGIKFIPSNASAWAVQASANALPLLQTDKTIEVVLYVDHTVVEAYYMGGRLAITSHIPQNLLFPGGANEKQSVEIFATGAEVTVLNATMWRMEDIWDPITHNRPHRKPAFKTDDTRTYDEDYFTATMVASAK